jgi:hypothetical protein
MENYPIKLEIERPERLSRLSTLFRPILAIPQLIVLYFLALAAWVILLVAWVAVVITGRYPVGMFDFIAGYLRWSTRVSGYLFLLTDKHPPFSLKD